MTHKCYENKVSSWPTRADLMMKMVDLDVDFVKLGVIDKFSPARLLLFYK